MLGGTDISPRLDEILARHGRESSNWGRQFANKLLDRTYTKSITEPEELIGLDRKIAKHSRERGAKRKSSRWSWYSNLNLPLQLTHEEHVVLAIRAETGVLAEERYHASNLSGLSQNEIRELTFLIEQGRQAFEKLVKHNLRLVFNWARPYAEVVPIDEVQDAFQAGVFGLIRGLQAWDYRRGFTLSTYVSASIRQSIQRWRANETQAIRIPVHQWSALSTSGYLRRVEDEEYGTANFGDDALPESSVVSGSLEAAKRALDIESYDMLSGGIVDAFSEENFDYVSEIRVNLKVQELLDTLPDRSASVIRMHNGIDADERSTLEQIGEAWGITRERVRQVENQGEALFALRVLNRSFDSVDDLIKCVGFDATYPALWNWLWLVWNEDWPQISKEQSHFKALKILLGKVGRANTCLG